MSSCAASREYSYHLIFGDYHFNHRALVADIDEETNHLRTGYSDVWDGCTVDLKRDIFSYYKHTTISDLKKVVIQAKTDDQLTERQCVLLDNSLCEKSLVKAIVVVRILFQIRNIFSVGYCCEYDNY